MNRNHSMTRYAITVVPCLIGILWGSGCAGTQPMALEAKSWAQDLPSHPIGMFTLKTTNSYKPSFRPAVYSIEIASEETGKRVVFRPASPYEENDESMEYLVSVKLEPGTYSIKKVAGQTNKILVIGSFMFPIDAGFRLNPNEIVYLGHVEMVNRKRLSGEPRSGSIIPLVDQAVCGYSNGTFDVSISDRSRVDIPRFKSRYPELGHHEISTKILSR